MALPRGLPQISDSGNLLGALGNDVVDTSSNKRVATATVGSPAAGFFHSTIVNRKSIPDISKDLGVRFGVNRIMVQSIYQLQDEFGPNGEPVWAAVNDTFGQIRFVGSAWLAAPITYGQYAVTSGANDYVEITFYGTGLNILSQNASSNRTYLVSVDGGATSSVVFSTTSNSAILNARNYSPNNVFPISSGLSLGVHTIRIYDNSSDFLVIGGFEILNTSSTLIVNPGSAYANGNELYLSSQQTPAYGSGFVNSYGTAGARGGRVLVYIDKDGAIKKDIQYVDTAAAYLSSASHTNEEVVRTYFPREFGAGRTDDFSRMTSSAISAAFTLDDGTTTLVGSSVSAGANATGPENTYTATGTANYLTLTFIGTGLDIQAVSNTNSASHSFSSVLIDGSSVGSISDLASTAAGTTKTIKVVSGLPYGVHTVKFSGNASTVSPGIARFTTYGPKKPTLPSGAVELADYNIMADYSVTTQGDGKISSGVLRKQSVREAVYSGTWTIDAAPNPTDSLSGYNTQTTTNGGYVQYTFFGTGCDIRYTNLATDSSSIAITINGLAATVANYPTLTASTYGSQTFSAGILNQAFASTYSGLSLRNLPLSVYTVRMTNQTASRMMFSGFDIITPIHSPKSNLYGDVQNTLPVGSCAISDNRKTSAIKESLPAQRAWAQAVGVTTNPTTNSSYPTFVPCPDLSATITINGTALAIDWSGMFYASVLSGPITNATNAVSQIYVDGRPVGTIRFETISITGGNVLLTDSIIVPVSPGTHKVDIYWCKDGAVTTLVASEDRRTLIVREL